MLRCDPGYAAQVRDIVSLVLVQAVASSAVGIGIGLFASFALTRYLSSFLYGVGRADPVSYVSVAIGVAAVVAIACVVPARRAAKIDPVAVLRQA